VILPSKQIKDKRDDEAEQQAGSERKIESKASPVDVDVAGELAQPWDFGPEGKEQSQNYQEDSKNNKGLAKISHLFSPLNRL
jgi:hypothetical protein